MGYIFAAIAAVLGLGVGYFLEQKKKGGTVAPPVAAPGPSVGVVPGATVIPGAHTAAPAPAAQPGGLAGVVAALAAQGQENMKNIAAPVSPEYLPAGITRNKAIQQTINEAGYTPPLVVDGAIGPKSVAGIKWWQLHHPPLAVDGVPGPKVLASMNLGPAV